MLCPVSVFVILFYKRGHFGEIGVPKVVQKGVQKWPLFWHFPDWKWPIWWENIKSKKWFVIFGEIDKKSSKIHKNLQHLQSLQLSGIGNPHIPSLPSRRLTEAYKALYTYILCIWYTFTMFPTRRTAQDAHGTKTISEPKILAEAVWRGQRLSRSQKSGPGHFAEGQRLSPMNQIYPKHNIYYHLH